MFTKKFINYNAKSEELLALPEKLQHKVIAFSYFLVTNSGFEEDWTYYGTSQSFTRWVERTLCREFNPEKLNDLDYVTAVINAVLKMAYMKLYNNKKSEDVTGFFETIDFKALAKLWINKTTKIEQLSNEHLELKEKNKELDKKQESKLFSKLGKLFKLN